jgi:hypothetical protein
MSRKLDCRSVNFKNISESNSILLNNNNNNCNNNSEYHSDKYLDNLENGNKKLINEADDYLLFQNPTFLSSSSSSSLPGSKSLQDLTCCSLSNERKKDGRLFPELPLYCEGMNKPLFRGMFHLFFSLLLPFSLFHLLYEANGNLVGSIAAIIYISSNMLCYGARYLSIYASIYLCIYTSIYVYIYITIYLIFYISNYLIIYFLY